MSEDCPLEIYTPEKIIEELSRKEESTQDILLLIHSTPPHSPHLKKLSKVFSSLSNCDHLAVIELTREKNRSTRLVSSFLIFSKMCEWCRRGENLEVVSGLYKEVFLVRYRDVDPNIRGLCMDFITDWVLVTPSVFCNNTYLKYLGLSLNDRADLVRKKGVHGFIKIIEKCVKKKGKCVTVCVKKENVYDVNTHTASFKESLEKNLKRVVEMSLGDKNPTVREGAKTLLLLSFNSFLLGRERVYDVLKRGVKDKKLLNLTLWNLLKNENVKDTPPGNEFTLFTQWERESLTPYFSPLHDLFSRTGTHPFQHFLFDRQDIPFLIKFTIQLHEEGEVCCGKRTNCYLELLSIFKIEKVSEALTLYRAFKNSPENIQIVSKMVLSLPPSAFKEEVEETMSLLEGLYLTMGRNRESVGRDRESVGRYRESVGRVRSCLEGERDRIRVDITNYFFLILKGLEGDFSSTVNFYLEKSQGDPFLRLFAIRSFDISEGENVSTTHPSYIPSTHTPSSTTYPSLSDYAETKIFSSLWATINKQWERLLSLSLSYHFDLKEVCELLFFVNGKLKGEAPPFEETPYDEETSLRKIHTEIKKYVSDNVSCLFVEEGVPYFFRFLEENVLTDLFRYLFLFVEKDTFCLFYNKLKNKNRVVEKIVEEYFNFLNEFYEGDSDRGEGREGCVKKENRERDNTKHHTKDNIRLLTNASLIHHSNASLIDSLEDFSLKENTINIGESLLVTKRSINTLQINYENVYSFSKLLKGKFSQENLIFRNLKNFIEKDMHKLYDSVCLHFVSHLNSNECVVLDSKLKRRCKLKTLLEKKSKGPVLSSLASENTTYL